MPNNTPNNDDARKNDIGWVFQNPFESGLIKPDAIDKILADPELLAIFDKLGK